MASDAADPAAPRSPAQPEPSSHASPLATARAAPQLPDDGPTVRALTVIAELLPLLRRLATRCRGEPDS